MPPDALDLRGANLIRLDIDRVDLSRADLSRADLSGAQGFQARLAGASLVSANLTRADFSGARLNGGCLWHADGSEARMNGADLSAADLRCARMHRADLSQADLSQAIVTDADLSWARLVRTRLDGAALTGARVYGVAAWGLDLSRVRDQTNLQITPEGHAGLTVNNLELAQFVCLMVHNVKIRGVIDTIGRKAVLILGRSHAERKAVLDALKARLRELDLVPIVFDRDKPSREAAAVPVPRPGRADRERSRCDPGPGRSLGGRGHHAGNAAARVAGEGQGDRAAARLARRSRRQRVAGRGNVGRHVTTGPSRGTLGLTLSDRTHAKEGDAVRPTSMLLTLAAASVLGCATPTGSDSDHGPKPTDPARIMQDHLRVYLKDPQSAQVQMRAVGRITTQSSLLTPTLYGWGICADVNAKNAYGGYTGFKPVVVLWRSGVGVFQAHGAGGAIDEAVARAACHHVGG